MRVDGLRLEWFHVADQGMTPVLLRGLLHLMLSEKIIGRNEDERVKWLWADIQVFYGRMGTVDALQELAKIMIKPKKGSVELAGSGAQVRACSPWTGAGEQGGWSLMTCVFHLSKRYNF